MPKLQYRRILLKISGEALRDGESNISAKVLQYIVGEVAGICKLGARVAVIVGGGNIVRGGDIAAGMGIDRVTGDYMGMLATVINGMALQSALTDAGLEARLQTALNLEQVAAPYIREKAVRHLDDGRVVVFAAGTGNPYFTTDTAAALRASEIGAEALLKATNVDAVYSGDPAQNKDAKPYSRLSLDEALSQRLGVMDSTALALCRDRKMPIHVFRMDKPGALLKVVQGGEEGTLLTA